MKQNMLLLLSLLIGACGGDDASTQDSLVVQECDIKNTCPDGSECYDLSQIKGQQGYLACVEGDPCDKVECNEGSCMIDETGPPSVVCVEF